MFRTSRVFVLLGVCCVVLLTWRHLFAKRMLECTLENRSAALSVAEMVQRYDGPRNLTNSTVVDYSQNGQSSFIDELLKGETGGFFVEAGAYNGEDLSNTLFFEKERGWTGLLIEPDPWNFYALLQRKRNVFSIQCCLSRADVVGRTMDFKQSDTMGRIVSIEDRKRMPGIYASVRCYPLDLILKVLGRKTVDLLSLDVEGHELEILRSFPFHEIDIRVLCVEFRHLPNGRDDLIGILAPKGYTLVKEIGDDLIFLRHAHTGI